MNRDLALYFWFEIYAREPGLSNRPKRCCSKANGTTLWPRISPIGLHRQLLLVPELFTLLMQKQTMCTGTVRANCLGMPRDIMKQTLNSGESTFRRKDNLVALKWRDKRDVNMLTSATDPRETETVTTRNFTNKVM